jgi:integrase
MSCTTRFNFTKTALAALAAPPADRRATYWDSKTRGLMLLVTAGGTKTFYVRRKLSGRSERICIGRLSEWTVERARAAADEINAACGRGENPADTVRTKRSEMTLDDLFNQYMERNGPHLRRPDKPRNNYRLYLSVLGNRKLSSIKHHEVDRLHKDLAKTKSNVTANIALKLLHVMYNKAINEWRIWTGHNPAHGIRKLREQSRDRFLRPVEMPFFMMAVELERNANIRDLVQLALLTGARRANLLAMRWDQLELNTAEWRIPETKNGTPQRLPLTAAACGILRQRQEMAESEWVFPGTGSSDHMVEPKSGWQRIVLRMELVQLLSLIARDENWTEVRLREATEAGLIRPIESIAKLRTRARQLDASGEVGKSCGLRFHDLRRTLGSWQARNGASLAIIGKSLHHKSAASTAIYARLDIDPIRESMEKAAAAMWRSAGQ